MPPAHSRSSNRSTCQQAQPDHLSPGACHVQQHVCDMCGETSHAARCCLYGSPQLVQHCNCGPCWCMSLTRHEVPAQSSAATCFTPAPLPLYVCAAGRACYRVCTGQPGVCGQDRRPGQALSQYAAHTRGWQLLLPVVCVCLPGVAADELGPEGMHQVRLSHGDQPGGSHTTNPH